MLALLAAAMLAAFTAAPACAGEGYNFSGYQAFSAEFSLIGGQYIFYVDAHVPPMSAFSGVRDSCLFSANLQRLLPTHDTMQFGGPVRIYLIPYRINTTYALPAGLYKFYVAPGSDCDWRFAVGSNNQNPAGIAPVHMLRRTQAGMVSSQTVSVSDLVQFYAQFRTDHEKKEQVSGTMQIVNGGKTWATVPLKVGQDPASKGDEFYADAQLGADAAAHLGANTVIFVVKIGSSEFASSGAFMLTK